MRDIPTKKRKATGAVLSAAAIVLLLCAQISFFIWALSQGDVPVTVMVILGVVPLAVIVGLIIALVGRIKEIKGGEEDAAAKYR